MHIIGESYDQHLLTNKFKNPTIEEEFLKVIHKDIITFAKNHVIETIIIIIIYAGQQCYYMLKQGIKANLLINTAIIIALGIQGFTHFLLLRKYINVAV